MMSGNFVAADVERLILFPLGKIGASARRLLLFVIAVGLAIHATGADAPKPLAPLPLPEQLSWQDGDFAMFLRFGLNTFTGEEQGTGKEEAKIFNPAKLDARQWVKLAKETGFKRVVLQVKGHEGFCLWPTKFTDYSVKSSPWRGGQGDVVRELVNAGHEAGLEIGFYLSCEDRHDPNYGTAKYNDVYLGELTELLTNYGPWSEVRFDNAGGKGAGAYGSIGINPKDRKQTYDWQNYFATVKRLQPKAIIVSVVGPGARWNGNNNGHSGEPNWATFNPASMPDPEPTNAKQLAVLNFGDPNGSVWLPAECCVALRSPHWFWRAEDDGKEMPTAALFNTFCKSVGRGNVLLLNVPLNADGLVPDSAVQRLRELHAEIENAFRTDLLLGKPASASNVRGNDSSFAAANAVDGKRETCWATDDTVTNECWLEVNLSRPTTFSISALREPISLGQRVANYRIEYLDGGEWKLAVHGTTIGRLKIERFKPVTAGKVRLVIEKTRACPLISQFSLYGQ